MNIEDAKKPGMPKRDWERILQYLKPNFTMFEWGSGGSTTFFSYFVKQYISVEHSHEWFLRTINQIEKEERANVILYWVNAPGADYTEYANKIHDKALKDVHFDAVLIDGRSRVECAKNLLDMIDEDCLVFLHDAQRDRYTEILYYYQVIDTTHTLNVMKKITPNTKERIYD